MASSNLPSTIVSRHIQLNSLSLHVLESRPSGVDASRKPPLVVLLHGFPELSYSWRHLLPVLSLNGYYAVAPDQRGYGLTCSEPPVYDAGLQDYAMTELVSDVYALIHELGYDQAAAIIGHDFGSLVAGFTVLSHPELTRGVIFMSAPFAFMASRNLDADFAKLDPPRVHYTTYLSSQSANQDMLDPPEGLHSFLRTYFHVKSGDWAENAQAEPLVSSSATSMGALLPPYYLLELGKSMPETLRSYSPTPAEIDRCEWLSDDDLAVYVTQFSRTTFQGGLNWYRAMREPDLLVLLSTSVQRTIPSSVAALFVAGERDWGVWQTYGSLDRMRDVCEGMAAGERRIDDVVEDDDGKAGVILIKKAGHWVQQERPGVIEKIVLAFLGKTRS